MSQYTREQVITAYFDWEESQDGIITNCEAFEAGAAYAATLRQAPAQGGVTEADEPIGHPRSETDTRDEIELFLRDAYAAGCHAARATSPMLAITYAHREAPKLRAALSAQQQGEAVALLEVTKEIHATPLIGAARLPHGDYKLYTAPPAQPAERVPEVDIKAAVSRFLGWRLPDNFAPDAGISFDREYAQRWPWPTGTNLLDADQAEAMLRYVLATPAAPAEGDGKEGVR